MSPAGRPEQTELAVARNAIDPHIEHAPLLIGRSAGTTWHALSVHLRASSQDTIAVVVQNDYSDDRAWNGFVLGKLRADGPVWDQGPRGHCSHAAHDAVRAAVFDVDTTVKFLTWAKAMARRAQQHGITDNLTARAAQTRRGLAQLELAITAYSLPHAAARSVALATLASGTFTGAARDLAATVNAAMQLPANN